MRQLHDQSPSEILVVDDKIDDLRLLSSLLEEQGYLARQAVDGEMAWIAVQTRLPDLILLDVKLPKIDGYELCDRLKTNELTQAIPIIFLSALDEIWSKVKAFEVGAVDYVTKPYQSAEFLARIALHLRNYLQVKHLHQQNQQLQKQMRLTQMVRAGDKKPGIDPYLLLQAINATRSGITITDATEADYPIIFVNDGFERMTGYSFDEIKGRNCRFLQNNDTHQPAIAEIHDCMEAGRECRAMLKNYRKDGESFWNEMTLSPVKDDRDNVIYYIGVQADVSDRIRALQDQERDKAAVKKMNRELVELTEKLNRIANSDGLTGVANRRHFDDYLLREWGRMMRDKQPISLILIDVDCFKLYNDTYGHLAGDDCLKSVAKTLATEACRATDLAARYGGEEFAVILPDTPNSGALKVAQRILQSMRQLAIAHAKSKVSSKIVTLSLGVATLTPQPGDEVKALVDQADTALYQAKDSGRDRACSAS